MTRGVLDCAALAAARRYVHVYGTFVPAENIPDLKALDVQLRLDVIAGLDAPSGSFWNGSGGACLDANGGSFGFEMRFDPAFSCDAGGPCGTCFAPVCISWVKATPVSASGLSTTTLTTPTGVNPGITNQAGFNSGCWTDASHVTAHGAGYCGVDPVRAQTWGLLKTLYR